jgi:hypothetical protein
MTAEVSKVGWPDLAIGLYEKLTERSAVISYDFKNFEIQVPSEAGSKAEHASWVANGTLKISTAETS